MRGGNVHKEPPAFVAVGGRHIFTGGGRMISMEKARELKSAGLAWEPKQFDFYHNTNNKQDDIIVLNKQAIADAGKVNLIWLPSLSQLLAEIEARGYEWDLSYKARDKGYLCAVFSGKLSFNWWSKIATPENAAADALLWILKQEVTP